MKTNNSTLTRKEKRWFAAASGWGLELEMGSGTLSHGKRSTIPLAPSVKVFVQQNLTQSPLTHNTIYSSNITAQIAQGTAATNRIGDSIHLDAISIRGVFDTSGNATQAGVLFRALLVLSTNTSTSGAFGGTIGASGLWYGSANNSVSHPNTHVAKVLCDETFTIIPTTSSATVIPLTLSCPMNIPFLYQTGSTLGQAANLFIVITSIIVGGSTGTTQTGNFACEVLTAFTDR